jgi:hypothetical protein
MLASAPLRAQTGMVRVRVTDANGVAIPSATVSLLDNWDRTARTLSTNAAAQILWKGLPFGEWSFYVTDVGFQPYRAVISICDAGERTIAVKLAPWPRQGPEQFVVYGPAFVVETIPMPSCQCLDLASPLPKPGKRK